MKTLRRLFTIETRAEALLVIYALSAGCAARGITYLEMYPGLLGYLLFAACATTMFIVGPILLDVSRKNSKKPADRS